MYAGVTPDFWMAFMAWELSLLDLKTLAYNSLKYAVFNSEKERDEKIKIWTRDWEEYVEVTLNKLELDQNN